MATTKEGGKSEGMSQMQGKTRPAIGEEGEGMAVGLLQREGFAIQIPSNRYEAFDLFASKEGHKFGINVKYSADLTGGHLVKPSNIKRMLTLKEEAKPAFLFLTKNYAVLFALEAIFTKEESNEVSTQSESPSEPETQEHSHLFKPIANDGNHHQHIYCGCGRYYCTLEEKA